MKVRDLKDWPPQPGRAFGRSFIVPTAGETLIEMFVGVRGKRITFTGAANGNSHTYDFEAPSEEVALELKGILESNIGKNLFSVGDAELSAIQHFTAFPGET